MPSVPVIALYLGESYASLGVFDLTNNKVFEKSVFLPQISFKNLLTQTKLANSELFVSSEKIKILIVTKYLDRLKNFRLGGSVAQVVNQGFENSYSALSSKSLSLAASSLVISINPETLNEDYLTTELARLRKINPDVNKVVLQVLESKTSAKDKELLSSFFETAGFKIFTCSQPENLGEVRKTLLNAGTEGIKEEILSDLKEVLGEETEILFWTQSGFKSKFQNCELFASSGQFISALARDEKKDFAFYLDHENFRVLTSSEQPTWISPWGSIPCTNNDVKYVAPHPFSEIRLDHLSMFNVSQQQAQYEPGPVFAGRGIKPLVIDLFHDELSKIPLMNSLFASLSLETQKQKLQNHFSVIEKGQAQNQLTVSRHELKKHLLEGLVHEFGVLSKRNKVLLTGPLASLIQADAKEFNWPDLIMKKGLL